MKVLRVFELILQPLAVELSPVFPAKIFAEFDVGVLLGPSLLKFCLVGLL